MKKKLTLIIAMAVTAMAALTGCCKHEWEEATCVAPRTCSLCGKTEGEVVDHTWVEATCDAPKTCSVCGTTEGEALGHKFSEAGYLTPAVCSVCGAEGEVKPNYFVEKGLNLVDTIPETVEASYIIYRGEDRMDFMCKTSPANISVNTTPNGDGTKTINIEYIMPLACEYHYDTEKQYYNCMMDAELYDFYTGEGVPEAPTNGDEKITVSKNLSIDGKDVSINGDVAIEWDQSESDWYSLNDNVDAIDLICNKTYSVTVPEDYDGLVLGIKEFVKNTTEEEKAEHEAKGFDPNKIYYADSTGDYNTYAPGGTFIRVGK